MATLFMDNGEVYGQASAMLDGMYAATSGVTIDNLSGQPAFKFASSFFGKSARKVLPSTYSTLFAAFRVRITSLPSGDSDCPYFTFLDVGNTAILTIMFDSTGRIVVRRGNTSGTELARSSAPIIGADTWHHFELKAFINSTTGTVQVRYDDNTTPAINITGANTNGSGNPIAQYEFGAINSSTRNTWFTDMHIWDTTGTRNTDFLGDVAVTTVWPNEDVQTGWTPNYRHKIGTGVLQTIVDAVASSPFALSCADSTDFEFGTGDYTLETFIRFSSLPTTTNRVGIIGKWQESSNQRSYELSKCGPSLNSGNIEFRISTDGAAGTVTTLISQPWSPETDRWYHVAVVRSSGQTMLFIDGIMQGVPVTDANNYFGGTGPFAFAAHLEPASFGPGFSVGEHINGWFDETRITKGVGRYTANFTPTTVAFGRSVGTDPSFASVVLLMGYDVSVADESSFIRTVTCRSGNGSSVPTPPNFPDDGTYQYQTINAEDTLSFGLPRDDTNISASLYHASATLTLSDNPANTETVTIAGQVYTFKTTLASAFDVLIGANMAATLANLVAAINQAAGSGTLYGTGTTANTSVYGVQLPSPQMQVVALLAGTAGNALTVSETLDGVWSGATLAGGANIPGPSSFKFTRMPPGVTTIRSIMAITRAYKTESGPAKMKTNFVGPSGTVTTGAEVSLPIEPAYKTDVFEADPDTSGPITPATMVQGRIQFNRTE